MDESQIDEGTIMAGIGIFFIIYLVILAFYVNFIQPMKTIFCVLSLSALLFSCGTKEEATPISSLALKTSFDPNAGKQISDAEAQAWAKSFATKYPDDLRGYYFSADSYKKVLSTPGAVGIRIYMGLNDAGDKVMLLTPTDKSGNTIEGGTSYEFGQACPPYCDGTGINNPTPTDSIK